MATKSTHGVGQTATTTTANLASHNIRKNLSVGDMVIIRKENVPPAMWVVGRVIEVFLAKDGLVRTARIRTPTGVFERSINRVVYLPQHQPLIDQPINGGDNV